jgi:hypothetical protein
MKTFLECTPSGMHAGMFSNLLSHIEIQGLVFRMSLQDQSIPRSFCFVSLLKTTTDHCYHKLIAIQEPPQKLKKPQNWLQLLATFVVAPTERI